VKGALKYDKPEPVLDASQQSSLGLVVKHITDVLRTNNVLSKKVSFDTSFGELVGSTSPGFPWTELAKTKAPLIESGVAYDICRYYEINLNNTIPPTTVWGSALKEEVLKTKKVLDENTRQINSAPMEHICALNIYCLEFNNSFYDSALITPNMVGLSPFHRGWDAAYRKLSVFLKGMSIDVSSFDAGMSANLLTWVKHLRLSLAVNWTEEDKGKFSKLYEDIINTVIVMPSGELLQKHLGNPSGSSNTIVDNTLVLWIVVYWSLFYYGNYTLLEIEEFFRFLLGGDDGTFTYAECVKDENVIQALERGFAALGWKLKGVTAAPLNDLHFFSNSFFNYRGTMVPKSIRPNKLVCALACKYMGEGPCETLVRATSIRVLLRYDPDNFELVSSFIRYIVDKYNPFLYDCKEWKDAKAQIWSIHEIDRMYLSLEF